jgi:TRAP-type C4-dicarboxylate transport system permease small subunit
MSGLDSPHQRRIRWWLEYFEEVVGGIALLAIIFSVSWGVITRYITEQPATWASEVANLSFAWLTFFGASACIKYRLHPSIDMLTASAPAHLRQLIAGFNHVLLLSFFGFMTWFGISFTIESWDTPSAVLQIPQSFLYGPVAVCSLLMIVRQVQVILRGVRQDHLNDETRGSHVG